MRTSPFHLPLSILAVLFLTFGAACGGGGGSPATIQTGQTDRNLGTAKRPKGTFVVDAPLELSKAPWSSPKLTISRPGHPLDSLEIHAKPSSISAGNEITVTSANVTSHSFGSRFSKVLSPMITIQGSSQSRGPILVRIPRPEGWNDNCDVVSVDPFENFLVYETTAGADSKFIDVFLYKLKMAGAAPKKGDQGGIVLVESRTPSSPTSLSVSRSTVDASSGFLPGQHDWPFVNRGSFASPGGDCTGMSLTAAYIFATSTGPTIRTDSRFTEETNDFTDDDRDSRRLVGKVQVDYGNAAALGAWDEDAFSTPVSPAALLRSAKKRFEDGIPCVLVLYNSVTQAGHAVVTFAAGASNLLIADPNFPGQVRELTSNSDGSQWNPFTAQLNADEEGSNYDLFYLVDPIKFSEQLEPLYKAALAGDVGSDAFGGISSYDLQDYCSKRISVNSTDNFVLENPDLRLFPNFRYLVGIQDSQTGVVEGGKYFHRVPGGTFEEVLNFGSDQVINLEKSIFEPEEEDCDFCSNMIPHRTKKPLDVDLRIPLYVDVNGRSKWFDSINIRVKMKPMELDPNAPRGVSKP